ncbi:hypothetical protein K402DRAFT_372591 [Aulographum hederae CBS 113979]|uniref:Iron-sulfur assembly protein 1 n=1 Tax=Aulographum hederae CBS 113979 TaxID=1176131 RepID=A0A6G1H7C7_9PEZI|nr:hypothetical protein K402DRAFT_372591 [Aulographum hederae CBS 113979]
MALPRATATSFSAFLNLASRSAASSSRSCPQCLRPFSSYKPFRQSSVRKLQTASAHQPSSLREQPPPPRNARVPDTSIAGSRPEVDKPGVPPEVEGAPENSAQSTDASETSVREGEAQKSKTSFAAQSSTSTTSSSRPKRPSKLRPRKAAMTLSQTAVSVLQELLDQPEPKMIRVGVKNRGCSGLAYHLEYVDKPGAFDEAVEQDGVKVLIDSKALFSIIGSEMDWVEDKLSRRFVFKNPNITEQCGCGESFSVSN